MTDIDSYDTLVFRAMLDPDGGNELENRISFALNIYCTALAGAGDLAGQAVHHGRQTINDAVAVGLEGPAPYNWRVIALAAARRFIWSHFGREYVGLHVSANQLLQLLGGTIDDELRRQLHFVNQLSPQHQEILLLQALGLGDIEITAVMYLYRSQAVTNQAMLTLIGLAEAP